VGEVHDLYISEIYGHGAVKNTTFSCQHNYGLQYSDGNPLTGASMQVRYAKIAILDKYLAIG